MGDAALVSSVGSDNTALGALARHNATTGSGNVYIGAAMRVRRDFRKGLRTRARRGIKKRDAYASAGFEAWPTPARL